MSPDPKNTLFVSDLDGTLLGPHGMFPAEWAERLNRLIGRGLMFTIATARTYDSTHPLLKSVNLQLPVILFNGVFLTEFHTGHNLIKTDFIPHEVVHGVMEILHPRNMDPFIYTHGEQNRVLHRKATHPGAQRYLNGLEGDRRLCAVKQFEFLDGEQIAGFLVIDSPERLEPVHTALRAEFPGELNLYFAEDISDPGSYWLQAFHARANKGRMLTRLAEQLDHPLERIVVFGDYLNDLEMFQVAGRSIAVSNALPAVREAADEIIGPNAEAGVLAYLESLSL